MTDTTQTQTQIQVGDTVTTHEARRTNDGKDYAAVVEATVVDVREDFHGRPMVELDNGSIDLAENVTVTTRAEPETDDDTDAELLVEMYRAAADAAAAVSYDPTASRSRKGKQSDAAHMAVLEFDGYDDTHKSVIRTITLLYYGKLSKNPTHSIPKTLDRIASELESRTSDDETGDEGPVAVSENDETCQSCGGVAAHVETSTMNSWINEASSYAVWHYECRSCGGKGKRTEHGDVQGCLVPVGTTEPIRGFK